MSDPRAQLIARGWRDFANWWVDQASTLYGTSATEMSAVPPDGDSVLDAAAKTVTLATWSWLYFLNEIVDTAAVATMSSTPVISHKYTPPSSNQIRTLELSGPLTSMTGQTIPTSEVVFQPSNHLDPSVTKFWVMWTNPDPALDGVFGADVKVLAPDGSQLGASIPVRLWM